MTSDESSACVQLLDAYLPVNNERFVQQIWVDKTFHVRVSRIDAQYQRTVVADLYTLDDVVAYIKDGTGGK